MAAPIPSPFRRVRVRFAGLSLTAVVLLAGARQGLAQTDAGALPAEPALSATAAATVVSPHQWAFMGPNGFAVADHSIPSTNVGSSGAQQAIAPSPAATPKGLDAVLDGGIDFRHSDSRGSVASHDWLGSSYIPMDSWIYPATLRLYAMGYLNSAFLSLRPWTRRSLLHMLELSDDEIRFDNNDEALDILDKLRYALRDEPADTDIKNRNLVYGIDSAYAGARVVGGTVLRDSWHLGQSFNNDYGRPYSNGFNSYNGISTITELGPFSLYVRGEYQHAPSYQAYSLPLAQQLALVDGINYGNLNPYISPNLFGGANIPEATLPQGLLPAQNNFRLLNASFAAHVFRHEISFGKSDAWLGPGLGGSMAWSNNAEDMYAFRINRVDPLYIPFLSRLIGTIRYDFFIGSLQGHTYPQHPYAHSEIVAIQPTKNFQMSFQRTIVWGGVGHEPITLHTFLKGFFSTDTLLSEKYSRNDPGARFSSITFSYRLPFLRRRVMLYTDSITHDDIFPISAPRRSGWRPGIYFSQIPYVPKLDFRVEATYTDYVTTRSEGGQGDYFESVQRQAYTNKGFIMGDWIGREAKGGQAWVTYHLSGNESIAVQYLRKKNGSDFIQGGTTQNIYRVDVIKRLKRDLELSAWFQAERWKAPIWKPGQQGSTTGAFQLTWYPALHAAH